MDRQKYDLTQGGILQKLLLVAIPIMGTQFLQMTYNLADMFWLGRVGSDAVAASGSAGMYMWLSMGVMMIGRMGAEIGVSQCMGRGERETARGFAHTAMAIALVAGTLFGLVLILFRTPLIGFFNIREANVARDAADYLAIAGIGMPFTYLTGAVTGTFNGAGNSRIPFYLNAVGLVINMILDPVLILALDMGIVGAALATITAQITVGILSLLAIRIFPARPFEDFAFCRRPEGRKVARIFRWTTPIALENVLFTLLSMVIARFVAEFGADAMAVQRVGSQVESLTWLIGGGFASAVTAFVGQNFGGGKWTRIRRGVRLSLGAMAVWGVLCTAILWIGAGALFAVFLPDEAIIEEGARYIRILCVCQILACLEFCCIGIFRGLGKTIPPSVSSITGNVLRIPLCYALSRTALGVAGLWWGISLGACLRSAIGITWYWIHSRRLPREDASLAGGEEGALPE